MGVGVKKIRKLRGETGLLKRSKRDASLLRWAGAKWLSCALLIVSLAGSGCTTAWVQERRLAPTGLAPADTIAIILTLPLDYKRLAELEQTVTGCIRDALGERYSDLRIILPDEFRKLAFPDLDKEKSPLGGFSWESFFRDTAFRDRITPLGLRYLVAVDIEDRTRLTDVEWGAANKILGGPGPIVQGSWERSALIQAVVVDARHRRVAGSVQAYATGKSSAGLTFITFPMPLPVPYGTVSFPLSVACRALGERLAQFLAGENPAEDEAPKQTED